MIATFSAFSNIARHPKLPKQTCQSMNMKEDSTVAPSTNYKHIQSTSKKTQKKN